VLSTILWLVVLTLAPALELRASIPYGLLHSDLAPWAVVVVCVVCNIALAPLVWLFMAEGVHLVVRIKPVGRLYDRIVVRSRHKLEPYVERWGTLGLALFIGIPLPGSGVYSGGLGGYLLGFNFKQYLIASVLGVMIAASVVTVVVLSGTTAFGILLRR